MLAFSYNKKEVFAQNVSQLICYRLNSINAYSMQYFVPLPFAPVNSNIMYDKLLFRPNVQLESADPAATESIDTGVAHASCRVDGYEHRHFLMRLPACEHGEPYASSE